MRTLWIGALLGLSLVGNGALAQKNRLVNGLGAGLKGEYFNGANFERKVLTRTDAQVNFDWNWQLPGPGVQHEYFSVRWTGKLYAPTSGKYRFSAVVDDGVRVWVGGKKVIDEWRKQDDSRFVGEISLNGRQFYDLRIEYYNDWKGSIISVYWERPEDRPLLTFHSVPNQLIPTKYLFSKPERPLPTAATAAKSAPARVVQTTGNRPITGLSTQKSTTLKPKPTSIKQSLPTFSVAVPADQPFANLRTGETIVLRQVIFAQSDYTLLAESCAELDKLVRALQANPALRLEIGGHTDNVGDKRLNQALSENRAKVVAGYLSRHGIADDRITAKGYGDSRPIASNTSETNRAQNRRVELVVVE